MTGGTPRTDAPGLSDSHADGRLLAPSASRNTQPIRDALRPVLADRSGLMLEIGSGTGQHIADWAAAFPTLDWQPSERDPANVPSIVAWKAHSGVANIRAPLAFDAAMDWPDLGPLSGVISCNVIHISPWAVAEGIVNGAARAVNAGGVLIFYGPFVEAGKHTGEGNEHFDRSLRARDPSWGIRDLDDVSILVERAGFGPPDISVMPANNRLVVFKRL